MNRVGGLLKSYLYLQAEVSYSMVHRVTLVLISASLGFVLYVARQQVLGSPVWLGLIVVSFAITAFLAVLLFRQSDFSTESGQWRLLEDVGVASTICGGVLLLTGGGGFRLLLGGVLAIGLAVRYRFTDTKADSPSD